MTFRQFAFNNVKRNARQYLSYFFSCMFSVAVFFIYAVIMYHPEIDGHDFRENVQRGIMSVEVIIFVFSFLFVLYSTGAFIKSRKKEYGLLMTLGISKKQLNGLLILENTIIGVVSIVSGLLVGIIFANIFIMGFSQILGIEGTLGFYIAPKAVILTVISYFIMFECNSIIVVWTLRTNAVIELFRGMKAPKIVPKFSWILSIFAIALIVSAYYLAATASIMTIFQRMFIILILIIPGTYFLYTQFSVAFISLLKRRKNVYYHQTNILTISELNYKMKDHARLLFFVTILSAISFTASGVLYSAFQSAETEAAAYTPNDFSFLSRGADNVAKMDQEIKKVIQSFEKNQVDFEMTVVDRKMAQITNMDSETWIHLMSYSDYKKLAELAETKIYPLNSEQKTLLMLPYLMSSNNLNIPDSITVQSKNYESQLETVPILSIVNDIYQTGYTIVVTDSLYQRFANVAESEEMYRYAAFSITNWVRHTDIVKNISMELNQDVVSNIDSKADFYNVMKNSLSHTLFFGLFISVLFFLAAGSILYFKMYQDLDKDIEQYKALYRIGLTIKEMKIIATKQIAYLFFIPFGLAVLHASFAFKALQNMLASSIVIPSITLISCYLLIYAVYFFFIRGLYIAKIKKVM
ncbi:putative ABC transport system permease protein [Gracilibacillus ureilyticus]|uniref:Putative ABC transport system permease protein n=1 Tax=Gracilibacillus ureilyticus TaxID=531814 RepID=A0A1H9QE88_9BACI|nr:ABC transporter permease [Gracilibacillus ureilyticus]SER58742.1 putative ABC transport system permease protein [Gracilibacillus ureilyticus]